MQFEQVDCILDTIMDDWQDAALTNRHLHNRVGKHGRGKGGKSNGGFNVQKTLGTYELKCPAAAKLAKGTGEGKEKGKEPVLEIYNLNELGNALVGEMILPGALHAVVLLAGSRKTMKVAERALEEEEEEDAEDQEVGESEGAKSANGVSEQSDGDSEFEEEPGEEDLEQRRYQQFEKNSFRNPKFWMSWQGDKEDQATIEAQQSQQPGEETTQTHSFLTGTGYLIFSGNNCEKFNATLSCEVLGWNNVKLTGFKLRSHTARDFHVQWTRQSS